MVQFLFEIKDLIWLLRLGLAAVFVSGIYLETQGTQFFNALAQDHITTSSILIFLSVMSFVTPFVKVKRKDNMGGVTVMRKLTVVSLALGGIVAVLFFLSMFHPSLLSSTIFGIGGGIGPAFQSLVTWFEGLPLNMWQWMLVGAGGGIGIYAAFAHSIWPRIHKAPMPQTEYQGAPTYQRPAPVSPQPQPIPVEQKQEA